MQIVISLQHYLALFHFAAVALGLLTYVVLSRGDRQRRPPSAAMAWVVGLLAFPYAALPLYLLLGARKVERGAELSWPSDGNLRTAIPTWAAQTTRGLDLPPCRENSSIRMALEGPESLQQLLEQLRNAASSIDASVYVFELDASGRDVLQALTDAAKRGVRVRILLDQAGNWMRQRAIRQAFVGTGVEWRWFNPVTFWNWFRRGNLRSHRKYCVVDRSIFWSGGRNFGDAYFHAPADGGWHDLSFVACGPIAGDAALLFQRDWGDPINQPSRSTTDSGPSRAQLLPSGPDFACDTTHDLLVNAVHRADHRVLVTTPYFVPTEALQQALVLACQRGVAVTLVIPARSNHRLADLARPRALRELAKAGARIRLTTGMTHAKAVVVDAILASCGSANLDGRSLYLNYELNTLFYDASEVASLAAFIDALATSATPYIPLELGWTRDLVEGLVRAIAFQL